MWQVDFLNSWICCCLFFLEGVGLGGVRGTGGKRFFSFLFIYMHLYFFMVCIFCVKGAIHVHWKKSDWHKFCLALQPTESKSFVMGLFKGDPQVQQVFPFPEGKLKLFINWLNLFIFVKQVQCTWLYDIPICIKPVWFSLPFVSDYGNRYCTKGNKN